MEEQAEMTRPETIKHGEDESIYSIFDSFIETTIIKGESLITDNQEKIFNKDNLGKMIEKCIRNPKTDSQYFSEKIKNQLKEVDESLQHIAVNLLYLRDLPNTGISKKTKYTRINPFKNVDFKDNPFGLGDKQKDDDDEKQKDDDDEKRLFPSKGIASYRTDRSTYYDFVELLLLFEYLFGIKDINKMKVGEIREYIKNWIIGGVNNRNVSYSKEKLNVESRPPIDHMLLNLCCPDQYSAIANLGIKQEIVKKLYKQYTKNEYNEDNLSFYNVDACLLKLCEKIKDPKKQRSDIFWSDILWEEPYCSQWKGGYVANAYEILTQYQKQVILYGAPGTGKTYSAEQVIKEFVYDAENNGKPKTVELKDYQYKDDYDWNQAGPDKEVELTDSLKEKNVIWEMVQFNQSYSYEDFIEGLRPTENGGLKIVHGIFKRFAKVAAQKANEGKKFVFIIDEINRGKIDKIFGELLYLLEYRDKSLRLHYSNKEFSIPQNVYIIGTMNTADKSIALLDVALRRRFWFVRCEPKRDVLFEEFGIEKDNGLEVSNEDNPENIKKLAIKLFDWLNGYEIEKTKTIKGKLEELGNDADELKIGHSYFLKLIRKTDDETIDPTFSDLKNIWFYSIVPLIEEYCGFDKNRVEQLLKNLSKKEDFTLENLKGDKKWN